MSDDRRRQRAERAQCPGAQRPGPAAAAGLGPIERGAAFLLIWRMLMKEGSYLARLLAAGGAADFVAANLPDFQLLGSAAPTPQP